jgi:hypothetical protein
MSAEALFKTGGVCVLDKPRSAGGVMIGCVWVESTTTGQLQRWVLHELMIPTGAQTYVFESWPGAPPTLDAWEASVRVQVPATRTWGLTYADGLWPTDGGYYVVAQSTHVLPSLQTGGLVIDVPEPTYPRKDAVETHGPAYHAQRGPHDLASAPRADASHRSGRPRGPETLGTPPHKPIPQTGVPFFEIRQSDTNGVLQPIGIGGGLLGASEKSAFSDGKELFLLFSGYGQAGNEGRVTRWQVEANPEIQDFASLLASVETKWETGQRCEVTGCNYYVGAGDAPPPAWFL